MTIFGYITIFECSIDPEHIFNVITTSEHILYFLIIFLQFSGNFWIDYHIWNHTQDSEIVLQDHYQQLAIPLNFSDVLLLIFDLE